MTQTLVQRGAPTILAVSALGGCLGFTRDGCDGRGGIAGFLRTITREDPAAQVRAIDVDPTIGDEQLALAVIREVQERNADADVEVGYHDGLRSHVRFTAQSLPAQSRLELGADSVVLLTGGARGITAHVAKALAANFRCKLELVGRTPRATAPEGPETQACATPVELRRALIAAAGPDVRLADVDARCRQILAEREISDNLRAIEALGAEVRYHAVDVRDEQALRALIADVYARHGRLDGVVHGAGVIEDKLLRDKSAESFDRVYDTKVVGARALLGSLRADARFVVFFSSVSSVYGSRGQCDYAAANDYLDKLARSRRFGDGVRTLAINWGPWRGAGMVSPEVERAFVKRGVPLIDPESGAQAFLDELVRGNDRQVVLTAVARGG